jgi:hypothetical protein
VRTDQIQAALRRREGLEAVDLGFRMARAWWRPLAAGWLVFVAPIAMGIILALRDHPIWALALLWWLRPVFARIPLSTLSRLLFGEPTGLLATAGALPDLLRSGLATSLFIQRLSPARTFLLPVLQLEGLRGAARRQRCAALGRRDAGSAMGLMAAGAYFNFALILGGLLLVQLLVPSEVTWSVFQGFEPLWDDGVSGGALLPVVYFLGTSVVEPLLVAGGFGLYLNRRVYLEGWDIDLALRRLTRRVEEQTRRAGPLSAAILAGLVVLAAAPAADAQEVCDPDAPGSANACIQSVLESDDFGSVREITRWVRRPSDESASAPWLDSLFGWLFPDWLPGFLASGFELGLWIGVAVLAVMLVMAVARRMERIVPAPAAGPKRRPRVSGLDLDPRSLPDDVVAAARAHWARGAPIEALSLLYRGALSRLVERRLLPIPDSATELECVRLVDRTLDEDAARIFGDLTRAWIATRYAGEPPPTSLFESLCQRYSVFGAVS